MDLQNWLQARMPEALGWLRRMVGINSFTANAEGVNWLGALTAECFEPLGFKPDFVPSEIPNYGRHLFLSHQGKGHETGRARDSSRHGLPAGRRGPKQFPMGGSTC